MSGTYIIQNLLDGISLGSIYALVAIGFSMTYSILRLINFAHGDIFDDRCLLRGILLW